MLPELFEKFSQVLLVILIGCFLIWPKFANDVFINYCFVFIKKVLNAFIKLELVCTVSPKFEIKTNLSFNFT